MLLISLGILIGLAPIWFYSGRACLPLRLPSISGFIVAGILSGPHVIGLLKQPDLDDISFVEHICLGYIGLLAGAELHLGGMKKIRRQVTYTVAAISLCSWAFVVAAVLLAAPIVPFLATLTWSQLLIVANLVGVLAVARSPASAIAVIKEMQGAGPYCSLVMAVTVVKDVIVFLAFAVAVRAAQQSVDEKATISPLMGITTSLVGILGSLLLGLTGGVLLHRIHSWTPLQRIPPGWARSLVPLALSSSVYFLSEALNAEPLLACVAMGAAMTQLDRHTAPGGGSGDQAPAAKAHASPHPNGPSSRQEGSPSHAGGSGSGDGSAAKTLHLSALLTPVSAVLFGLVGAGLHVDKLLGNAQLAAVIAAVRVTGIWVGSWAGSVAGGVPQAVRDRLWMGMITQAGIAVGLTRAVVNRCDGAAWGPDFEALMAGVVVANLTLGPPLFRGAIAAAGEAYGQPRILDFATAGSMSEEGGMGGFETPRRDSSKIERIPIIEIPNSGSKEMVL